ncbi:MAG: hypothetical protein ACLVJ6_17995 [Merdibacter sp.]
MLEHRRFTCEEASIEQRAMLQQWSAIRSSFPEYRSRRCRRQPLRIRCRPSGRNASAGLCIQQIHVILIFHQRGILRVVFIAVNCNRRVQHVPNSSNIPARLFRAVAEVVFIFMHHVEEFDELTDRSPMRSGFDDLQVQVEILRSFRFSLETLIRWW